jgi:hypothetical protein
MERRHPQRHDQDFRQLDAADQSRFLELVGDLPGGRRKQKERQHENPRRDGHQDLAVTIGGEPVEREDDQRVLEQVVVHRAQELGNEKRQEATGLQE